MQKYKLEDLKKVKTAQMKPRVSEQNFPEIRQKKSASYNMLWVIALISVVFLFFAISFLFESATVTIVPKTKDFTLDRTLTATKDASGNLPYDLVVLSGEESKQVAGGPVQNYLEYATGKVLIYNAFSASPQPLAEGTRLEGSNGKIYKIKTKVIVPGMLKNGIPGKIDADIYASEVGPEYDSPPLDFKIAGFKGTSKYSKFYARSVGAINGGLKGKSSQVSDADKVKVTGELTNALMAKLFEKAKNQTPANFVLLKNAAFLNVDETDINPAPAPDNFMIDIKGTFTGILFNKDKLTREVISESSVQDGTLGTVDATSNTGAASPNVYVFNIENLSIASFDQNLIAPDNMQDFSFNLSGTVKIVWRVDTDKIASDLLGKSKADFKQILSQYPDIDSADLVLKPIWINSLPSKAKDIKVIVNYPK